MGWRRTLRPIPLLGLKSISTASLRCASVSLFQSSHEEESVSEAPKPSICWNFTASFTVIVRFGARAVPKVRAGFSCSVSCCSSEDSTTSIRGASFGDAVFCCGIDSGNITSRINDRPAANGNLVNNDNPPPLGFSRKC